MEYIGETQLQGLMLRFGICDLTVHRMQNLSVTEKFVLQFMGMTLHGSCSSLHIDVDCIGEVTAD